MSRLDRHVAAVQNKLALTRFIDSLALTVAIAAGGALATILPYKLFPMSFPRPAMVAIGLAIVAALSFWLLPNFDLFGREAAVKRATAEVQKQDAARKSVERALATVNAVPKALADDESVKLAKK